MLIQVGTINMNNTWKLLVPVLKEYGEEFLNKFNNVFKVAAGLGDMLLIKNNIRYEKHIFVLMDTKICKKFFLDFINFIKDHESYEDDYCFDDIQTGHLHMVVLKIPVQHYRTLEKFKHSQFSSMYSTEQINNYFKNNPEISKILVKDNQYKFDFVKKLNYLYETTIQPNEYEGELELPIKQHREYFNTERKKK